MTTGIVPTVPLPKVIAACLDMLPYERNWTDFEFREWMEMFEGACRVWYRLPDPQRRNVVHPDSVPDYGSSKPWSEVRERLTSEAVKR